MQLIDIGITAFWVYLVAVFLVWVVCRNSRRPTWTSVEPGRGAKIAAVVGLGIALFLWPDQRDDLGALALPLSVCTLSLMVVAVTGLAAARWSRADAGAPIARLNLAPLHRRLQLVGVSLASCLALVLIAQPFAASNPAKFARTLPDGREVIAPGISWPGGWDGAAIVALLVVLGAGALIALDRVRSIPQGPDPERDERERFVLASRIVRGLLFGTAGTASVLAFTMWNAVENSTQWMRVRAGAAELSHAEPPWDWVQNAGYLLLVVAALNLFVAVIACTRPPRHDAMLAEQGRRRRVEVPSG